MQLPLVYSRLTHRHLPLQGNSLPSGFYASLRGSLSCYSLLLMFRIHLISLLTDCSHDIIDFTRARVVRGAGGLWSSDQDGWGWWSSWQEAGLALHLPPLLLDLVQVMGLLHQLMESGIGRDHRKRKNPSRSSEDGRKMEMSLWPSVGPPGGSSRSRASQAGMASWSHPLGKLCEEHCPDFLRS